MAAVGPDKRAQQALRWWSSELRRDSASRHGGGGPAIQAIQLEVPSAALRASGGIVEVAVGNVVIRFDPGVDVG